MQVLASERHTGREGQRTYSHCTLASGYTGPGIKIRGDFRCHDNSGACVADNGTVVGDAHIQNNISAVASDISLNTIGRNLRCSVNFTLDA